MDRWRGKIALVTGASSGIGAATAVELANRGLKVVGVARRVDKIETLKDSIIGPGELHALKADINQDEDIDTIFTFIKSSFGSLHVLVNNAGIYRPGTLLEQNIQFMRDVININVISLSLCTQKAYAFMKESGVDDGHIIHINSIAGHGIPQLETGPAFSIYPASKYAVTAITETLRQELRFQKSNIRITSISPGYVDTEIRLAGLGAIGAPIDALEESYEGMPSLESQDIADAIIYVLSTPPRVQVHELIIKPVGECF